MLEPERLLDPHGVNTTPQRTAVTAANVSRQRRLAADGAGLGVTALAARTAALRFAAAMTPTTSSPPVETNVTTSHLSDGHGAGLFDPNAASTASPMMRLQHPFGLVSAASSFLDHAAATGNGSRLPTNNTTAAAALSGPNYNNATADYKGGSGGIPEYGTSAVFLHHHQPRPAASTAMPMNVGGAAPSAASPFGLGREEAATGAEYSPFARSPAMVLSPLQSSSQLPVPISWVESLPQMLVVDHGSKNGQKRVAQSMMRRPTPHLHTAAAVAVGRARATGPPASSSPNLSSPGPFPPLSAAHLFARGAVDTSGGSATGTESFAAAVDTAALTTVRNAVLAAPGLARVVDRLRGTQPQLDFSAHARSLAQKDRHEAANPIGSPAEVDGTILAEELVALTLLHNDPDFAISAEDAVTQQHADVALMLAEVHADAAEDSVAAEETYQARQSALAHAGGGGGAPTATPATSTRAMVRLMLRQRATPLAVRLAAAMAVHVDHRVTGAELMAAAVASIPGGQNGGEVGHSSCFTMPTVSLVPLAACPVHVRREATGAIAALAVAWAAHVAAAVHTYERHAGDLVVSTSTFGAESEANATTELDSGRIIESASADFFTALFAAATKDAGTPETAPWISGLRGLAVWETVSVTSLPDGEHPGAAPVSGTSATSPSKPLMSSPSGTPWKSALHHRDVTSGGNHGVPSLALLKEALEFPALFCADVAVKNGALRDMMRLNETDDHVWTKAPGPSAWSAAAAAPPSRQQPMYHARLVLWDKVTTLPLVPARFTQRSTRQQRRRARNANNRRVGSSPGGNASDGDGGALPSHATTGPVSSNDELRWYPTESAAARTREVLVGLERMEKNALGASINETLWRRARVELPALYLQRLQRATPGASGTATPPTMTATPANAGSAQSTPPPSRPLAVDTDTSMADRGTASVTAAVTTDRIAGRERRTLNAAAAVAAGRAERMVQTRRAIGSITGHANAPHSADAAGPTSSAAVETALEMISATEILAVLTPGPTGAAQLTGGGGYLHQHSNSANTALGVDGASGGSPQPATAMIDRRAAHSGARALPPGTLVAPDLAAVLDGVAATRYGGVPQQQQQGTPNRRTGHAASGAVDRDEVDSLATGSRRVGGGSHRSPRLRAATHQNGDGGVFRTPASQHHALGSNGWVSASSLPLTRTPREVFPGPLRALPRLPPPFLADNSAPLPVDNSWTPAPAISAEHSAMRQALAGDPTYADWASTLQASMGTLMSAVNTLQARMAEKPKPTVEATGQTKLPTSVEEESTTEGAATATTAAAEKHEKSASTLSTVEQKRTQMQTEPALPPPPQPPQSSAAGSARLPVPPQTAEVFHVTPAGRTTVSPKQPTVSLRAGSVATARMQDENLNSIADGGGRGASMFRPDPVLLANSSTSGHAAVSASAPTRAADPLGSGVSSGPPSPVRPAHDALAALVAARLAASGSASFAIRNTSFGTFAGGVGSFAGPLAAALAAAVAVGDGDVASFSMPGRAGSSTTGSQAAATTFSMGPAVAMDPEQQVAINLAFDELPRMRLLINEFSDAPLARREDRKRGEDKTEGRRSRSRSSRSATAGSPTGRKSPARTNTANTPSSFVSSQLRNLGGSPSSFHPTLADGTVTSPLQLTRTDVMRQDGHDEDSDDCIPGGSREARRALRRWARLFPYDSACEEGRGAQRKGRSRPGTPTHRNGVRNRADATAAPGVTTVHTPQFTNIEAAMDYCRNLVAVLTTGDETVMLAPGDALSLARMQGADLERALAFAKRQKQQRDGFHQSSASSSRSVKQTQSSSGTSSSFPSDSDRSSSVSSSGSDSETATESDSDPASSPPTTSPSSSASGKSSSPKQECHAVLPGDDGVLLDAAAAEAEAVAAHIAVLDVERRWVALDCTPDPAAAPSSPRTGPQSIDQGIRHDEATLLFQILSYERRFPLVPPVPPCPLPDPLDLYAVLFPAATKRRLLRMDERHAEARQLTSTPSMRAASGGGGRVMQRHARSPNGGRTSPGGNGQANVPGPLGRRMSGIPAFVGSGVKSGAPSSPTSNFRKTTFDDQGVQNPLKPVAPREYGGYESDSDVESPSEKHHRRHEHALFESAAAFAFDLARADRERFNAQARAYRAELHRRQRGLYLRQRRRVAQLHACLAAIEKLLGDATARCGTTQQETAIRTDVTSWYLREADAASATAVDRACDAVQHASRRVDFLEEQIAALCREELEDVKHHAASVQRERVDVTHANFYRAVQCLTVDAAVEAATAAAAAADIPLPMPANLGANGRSDQPNDHTLDGTATSRGSSTALLMRHGPQSQQHTDDLHGIDNTAVDVPALSYFAEPAVMEVGATSRIAAPGPLSGSPSSEGVSTHNALAPFDPDLRAGSSPGFDGGNGGRDTHVHDGFSWDLNNVDHTHDEAVPNEVDLTAGVSATPIRHSTWGRATAGVTTPPASVSRTPGGSVASVTAISPFGVDHPALRERSQVESVLGPATDPRDAFSHGLSSRRPSSSHDLGSRGVSDWNLYRYQ